MKKASMGVLFAVHCFTSSGAFAVDAQPTAINEQQKPISRYTISIASPHNEETFQNAAETITVSVNVTPALETGDTVAVYVDGTQSGEPQASTTLTVPQLERGSHTLQAKVMQPKGKGAESGVITIYQQRVSKLLPAS